VLLTPARCRAFALPEPASGMTELAPPEPAAPVLEQTSVAALPEPAPTALEQMSVAALPEPAPTALEPVSAQQLERFAIAAR
jgi:hypothetical protein